MVRSVDVAPTRRATHPVGCGHRPWAVAVGDRRPGRAPTPRRPPRDARIRCPITRPGRVGSTTTDVL